MPAPPSTSDRTSTFRRGRAPTSLSLARRLWRDYLSRYWPQLAIGLAATAVYAISASLIPAGVEWINAALSGEKPKADFGGGDVLIWGPALIVGLGLVNALAQYVQTRMSATAALSALRDLQGDIHNALVSMDEAQVRAVGSGPASARLTNDVMVLRETLTRASSAVRDGLTLIGLCAVMVWYDWALFVVVLIIYPVIGWPVATIGRRLRKSSAAAQDQAGEIAGLAHETVTGARTIRAYAMEQREGERGRTAFERRRVILQRMADLRAANEPFIFFVGSIALAVVVAVVALRVAAGALNVPQFISFIIALLLLSQPARGLSTLNAVAQEGFGAFERILGLLDTKPSIKDSEKAEPLAVSKGVVSFRNVTFSYDGKRALEGFSLEAPGGARVALVGRSGAGKTTVFNLLLRLFDCDEGAIEIDGVDIRHVTLASLRANIAVVSQDALLFDDTIAENIAVGRPGASRAEIVDAAKAAAAHDFIEAEPGGYDARVGELGGDLSGGQRQRIAIARAFLKDAPILLLDEATSALDAESEAAVGAALERLSKGRTTIVIAHRLATVRDADLIAVMEDGRVVETGGHDALTRRDGAYARAAALQLG